MVMEHEALKSEHDASVQSASPGSAATSTAIFSYLASAYEFKGLYHRAIEMDELHRDGAKASKNREWEGIACCNLGDVYIRMGQHEKALALFTTSTRSHKR